MDTNQSLKENKAEETHNEFSLMELVNTWGVWVRYLLSRWLVLLPVILVGGLLGFTYAQLRKPAYTATTTFVLEEGGGAEGVAGQYAGLASMVGIEIGGSGSGVFSNENIMALYKSRTMLQKVLLSEADFNGKKQLLIDRYIELKKYKEQWKDTPKLSGLDFSDPTKFTILHDSIMGMVIKEIKIGNIKIDKPDKNSSIMQVDFISKDQLFAKDFSDRLVEVVNDFYVQSKTKKSQDNLHILQHQTDSVKAVMNGAIFSAASTVDATPNLNPTRQILRAPIQRSQFNAESNKLMLAELVKNLEMAKISMRKETPLIQIIDAPILPLPSDKISKVFATIAGILLGGLLGSLFLISKKVLSK